MIPNKGWDTRKAEFIADRSEEVNLPQVNPKTAKYLKEIKPGVFVDVYDVLWAWQVLNPALQHLIKKALQAGARGHKDLAEDMDDIVVSANRAKDLVK